MNNAVELWSDRVLGIFDKEREKWMVSCARCRDPFATVESLIAHAPYCKGMSREQKRSRRRHLVRARTISVKRMTKRELELGRLLYPEEENQYEKPRTRAECAHGVRPCPFVSCRWHLYLEVSAQTGAIKLNFPDLEPSELSVSCALDVADRGGETLEQVGAIMNITRERLRQLEVSALEKLRRSRALPLITDFDEPPRSEPKLGEREKADVTYELDAAPELGGVIQ